MTRGTAAPPKRPDASGLKPLARPTTPASAPRSAPCDWGRGAKPAAVRKTPSRMRPSALPLRPPRPDTPPTCARPTRARPADPRPSTTSSRPFKTGPSAPRSAIATPTGAHPPNERASKPDPPAMVPLERSRRTTTRRPAPRAKHPRPESGPGRSPAPGSPGVFSASRVSRRHRSAFTHAGPPEALRLSTTPGQAPNTKETTDEGESTAPSTPTTSITATAEQGRPKAEWG